MDMSESGEWAAFLQLPAAAANTVGDESSYALAWRNSGTNCWSNSQALRANAKVREQLGVNLLA